MQQSSIITIVLISQSLLDQLLRVYKFLAKSSVM